MTKPPSCNNLLDLSAMPTPLRRFIRATLHPAICTRCMKEGCRLETSSVSPLPIIVDADIYRQIARREGKICDYIVFPLHRISVLLIEMKGRLDASKAVTQLQAAAAELEGLIAHLRDIGGFLALVLSAGSNAAELKVLSNKKVRFRGKVYPIIKQRCGARLADILGKFG